MATNYSLRQLRYFVAVVEGGGVAQASRHLNISQPSVSVAVKELEMSFGMQMFVRQRSSGMTLTPVGQRVYLHALQLLKHAREFEQRALGENDIVAGEISLACFETLAPLYAPGLIASFRERYPDVTIRLHIGAQEKIIEGLRSGAYDLAICYVQGLSASIDHVALLPDLYPRAVLPRSHRFASRTSLSLSMLADDDLILLDIWPSNEYFLTLFDEAGVAPRVAYRVPSIELVRGLVGQGLGFSVLVTEPPHGMTFDGREVVTIPLTDRMIPSRTVMAWHGSTALTRLTRTFLHHCQSHIEIPAHIAPPEGYVAAPIPPGFTSKPSQAKISS
ncbi:LysR family transcriptional regulator [Ancylobacter sonchi]|uniref:LysR substrate-binding domain-containing protein n=1 Tax=Ancylobacter sonchi TaxID=1937790 RepID=UPI001BD606F9|nr:LysR substrate-binding domain-containing protein [Ancylobacter sonchi]MBS7532674.1 LysR family transcriptional regulator [Ancylobacter sonchi]